MPIGPSSTAPLIALGLCSVCLTALVVQTDDVPVELAVSFVSVSAGWAMRSLVKDTDG